MLAARRAVPRRRPVGGEAAEVGERGGGGGLGRDTGAGTRPRVARLARASHARALDLDLPSLFVIGSRE